MSDKCKRCGKCCFLRILVMGVIINTSEKCKHLTKDNLCDVYNNRPNWCLTAKRMEELNILPDGCGYKGGA